VKRIIIKIAAMAFFFVILCMPPIFAQDPQPLQCTVTMNFINFGTIDVWKPLPEVVATGRIECNRTPKSYMRMYFDMGGYIEGDWRRMKRYNPSSNDHIYYGLYSEDGKYLWDSPMETTYIELTQECFRGYIFCNFKITGKVTYFSPHPDFYAGSYSDLCRVRLRYWSEY